MSSSPLCMMVQRLITQTIGTRSQKTKLFCYVSQVDNNERSNRKVLVC